jgi:flagellin-like protein
MRIKRERRDAVSPVIAVILMVAITVVLAGVLYVWVTSLSTNEEDMVVAYRLTVRDSQANLPAVGDTFQVDDLLVRVEHSGGGPIDWTGHTVYLEKQNTSERIEIAIDSIAGQPYGGTNTKSEVGNLMEFKAMTTDFTSGEWIKFIVIHGSNQRYKSPGYMPIY